MPMISPEELADDIVLTDREIRKNKGSLLTLPFEDIRDTSLV